MDGSNMVEPKGFDSDVCIVDSKGGGAIGVSPSNNRSGACSMGGGGAAEGVC